MLPPDMAFPFKPEDGKMGGEQEDVWKLASLSLPFCLNCREAPDSKNWFYDKSIKLFRRTDDPEFGYAHGNVDGYWYLNNEYHLRSVYLGEFDRPTRLQNLRLAGPKGSITLAALDEILSDSSSPSIAGGTGRVDRRGSRCRDAHRQGRAQRWPEPAVERAARDESLGGARRAGLEIRRQRRVHPSLLRLPRQRRGDVFERYTRLRYHRPPPAAAFWCANRCAPKTPATTFGQFTYRNYFGAHSVWTRGRC